MKAVVIYEREKGNGDKETVTEYFTLVQQIIDVGRTNYLWLNDSNILKRKQEQIYSVITIIQI